MDWLTEAPRHMLPGCKGRTWFEALVEGWHDQAMLRLHLESLHALEMQRAYRPPPVEVTITDPKWPVSGLLIDPAARTVAVTIRPPQPRD